MDATRSAPKWARRVVVGVIVALVAALAFRVGDSRSDKIDARDPTAWVAYSATGEVLQINGISGEVLSRVRVGSPNDLVQLTQIGASAFGFDQTTGEVVFLDGRTAAAGPKTAVAGADSTSTVRSIGSVARLITPRSVVTLDPSTGTVGQKTDLPDALTSPVLLPDGTVAGSVRGALHLVSNSVADVGKLNGVSAIAGADGKAYALVDAAKSLRSVDARASVGAKRCIAGALGGSVIADDRTDDRYVVMIAPDQATVSVTDVPSNTCRAGTLEDVRSGAGVPVVVGGSAFIPLYKSGELAVIRLADATLSRRIPVAVPGHRFELFNKDGLLWVNDPASTDAVVINDALEALRINKTIGGGVSGGSGAAGSRQGTTGDPTVVGGSNTRSTSTNTGSSGGTTGATGAGAGTGTAKGSQTGTARGAGSSGPGTNVIGGPEQPAAALVADFTFSSSVLNVDQTDTFTDRSTGNPTAWTWDFGDGTFGSGPKVNHSWKAPGDYLVTLRVDNDTTSAKASATITVITPETKVKPKADFSFTAQRVEVGASVTFTDRSKGNPTELKWSFGDGSVGSGGVVTKSWSSPGTYIVTLTASNSEGTDSSQLQVTVFDKVLPPSALIETSARDAFVGQSITFFSRSSGNPTDVKWNFGDNTTASGVSVRHAYTAPGTYNASLEVSNSAGSDTATLQITVRERVVPPQARIAVSTNVAQEGDIVRFTSLSINNPTTTTWDFGDGTTATGVSVSKAWPNQGNYNVTLHVANSAGASEAVEAVRIVPNVPAPQAAFTFAPASPDTATTVTFTDTSTGPVTEWEWDFGDGTPVGTQKTASHVYAKSGPFTVRLTVTNRAGSASTTRPITVRPPAPVASFVVTPAVPLIGAIAQFTDTSTGGAATTWTWDFGDGTTAAVRNPSHTYLLGGTYAVKLTVANESGTNSLIRNVVVSPPAPIAAFTSAPAEPIATQTVQFTDTSGGGPATTYSWAFGDGATSTDANPLHAYATAGTYTVSMTAANAAGASTLKKDLVIAPIPPPPVPEFTITPSTIIAGESVTIANTSNGGAPTVTTWTFGDGSPVFNGYTPPPHTYVGIGTFPITLTMSNPGNTARSVTHNVVVQPAKQTVVIEAPVPSPPVVGSAATFHATVTGGVAPYTYAWTFPGATPNASALAAPAVTYSSVGPQGPVTLTVTDSLGRAVTAVPLPVTTVAPPPPPPPSATLAIAPSGPHVAPVALTFTVSIAANTGLGPFTYAWPTVLPAGASYVIAPTTASTSAQILFTQGVPNGVLTVIITDSLSRMTNAAANFTVADPPPPPTTTGPPTTT